MNNNTLIKWADLRNRAVYVPKLGKSLGTIVDFYFEEDTGAINALRVRTRVEGDYALPVMALKRLESDRVTIANENMLIRLLPAHPQSEALIGRPVVDEKDNVLGRVSDIWLATEPLVALRLGALEITPEGSSRTKTFPADAIVSSTSERIVIQNQVARKLR
ncbi:PRC-barrel domain protein [Thermosporothrix hazakensis]|uniref:PRC-barrel domain protein n=2 Tax=Thermosporothrix TaxID=768650 RepID=A0A326UBA7_THEHA|nr:PRC-barrel domain-containing protein [Thermosporothrix hazakensis]PZW22199.1 PRC-barrel domain protein [Thermosporothrix hazakensis]BBH89882.1 hypothetical protein KTC_46330 [Thermosporothrix sp. COM3]GCE48078.1 hypothetical protein KTH_29470 [Thermosporothrix hazakensis]